MSDRYDFEWDGVKYHVGQRPEPFKAIRLPDGYFLMPRSIDHTANKIVTLEAGYKGTMPKEGAFLQAFPA